jgi:hypothetical protein
MVQAVPGDAEAGAGVFDARPRGTCDGSDGDGRTARRRAVYRAEIPADVPVGVGGIGSDAAQ